MMGCFCFKASDTNKDQPTSRRVAGHSLHRQSVVPRADSVVSSTSITNGRAMHSEKQFVVMVRTNSENDPRKGQRTDHSGRHGTHHATSTVDHHPRITSIPRDVEGEQVAAGWPPWLASVAGEAIRGWIPRRADSFEKLNKIGQGTYSNVYRARDLDNEKIVALKKVRFDNLEPESVRFMAREIHILRRLNHPNVIKLEGLVTSRMSCSLYLVFEYMEHDLAGLASNPSVKFTEPQVKCFMQQLLCGLDHCHSRGVLHRDIKGSNLLIDNNGILKIADFGLATFFYPGQRQPLTSRVVTLWYRPPELLLGATEYGASVDLWSTGCILAELFASKPIMPGRTEVEQLHKIFKLCGSPTEEYWRKSKLPHATIFKPQHPYRRCVAETFKDFPPPALALVEVLLAIDPADRGTTAAALKSVFFTTKPYACDPSSLPKYPPSKEIHAKLRDEEARRTQRSGRGSRQESRKVPTESRAMGVPDANAELAASLQKRQVQSNAKSTSEKFHVYQDDMASGFPIDPPKHGFGAAEASAVVRPQDKISHSGPLVHAWPKKHQSEEGMLKDSIYRDSSSLTRLVGSGRAARPDGHKEASVSHQDQPFISGSGDRGSRLRADQERLHFQGRMSTHQQKDAKASQKDPSLAYGSKGSMIHYSGPLVRSGNIDQVLKDHERQIQDTVRRARMDKIKGARIPAGG